MNFKLKSSGLFIVWFGNIEVQWVYVDLALSTEFKEAQPQV